MNSNSTRLCSWFIMAMLAVIGCGCGGDDDSDNGSPPPVTCANLGHATYVGTEDVTVTSGICPSYTDLDVTFTIAQDADACTFTLQSSLLPLGTTFNGTVSGNEVSWTGSYPQATGTVTITSVDAQYVATATDTTLVGSFDWSYAGTAQCTGTTSFDLARQQ